MQRLAALLFLAGIAVAALLKRRVPRPPAAFTDSVVISEQEADRLALLLCDCPDCMPSWSVH
ncbi:hypothetical protein D9Y22_22970 [Methylorubrum sp. DB1722]|nr:hypothetical protein [Methylorubrum sp. DB1722]